MTITDSLIAGRAAAEARMRDECLVTRGGGDPTFDPNTGVYTNTAGTTVYEGACEVQISDGLNASTSEAGGQVVTERRVTVKVPISAEGIQPDDVVTITASELDPDLVDQTFRVLASFAKSFATSRRLQVEAVDLD